MKARTHILIVFLSGLVVSAGNAQFVLDVETGGVFPGYNDVRIPGKGGTQISLTNELSTSSGVFVRGRISYSFGERHTLSALVAPFVTTATGELGKAVVFEGKTFAANVPLEAKWKFNSYRLTYRYDFTRNENIEFGLGLTGKIRDAEIRLSGGGEVSSKTDLGFVPLVNLRLLWNATPTTGLLLEADALAAPQGRAEDVLAAVVLKPSEKWTLRLGYRILEGGADNDKVYNFALFHYAVAGVTLTL